MIQVKQPENPAAFHHHHHPMHLPCDTGDAMIIYNLQSTNQTTLAVKNYCTILSAHGMLSMLFDLVHLEDGALGRFGTSTHITLGLHGKFGRGIGLVLV